MSEAAAGILVIGYGNPGRLDDGLGPELARIIAGRNLPGVETDSDYQLTVEDAAVAAEVGTVIFADADTSGPEPFWMKRLTVGSIRPSFSSHSISPEGVLALARELFDAKTEAWLLASAAMNSTNSAKGSPPARGRISTPPRSSWRTPSAPDTCRKSGRRERNGPPDREP